MDKFSKDLLENNKECSAEFINYIGRVSMPYSHYHEHYEILYVCENSRGLIINNKDRYILDNSNVALIKPFILHRTLSGADKKQKRMLVNFSKIFADEMISFVKCDILNCFNAPVISVKEDKRNEVWERMKRLSELDTEDAFYEAEFKTVLLELLIMLSKEQNNRAEIKNDSRAGVKETVEMVAKKIQQCYSEDISLNSLAEEFHISPCYLSRCFKLNMGISLVKYINNVRITAAQKFIGEGYSSVTAVAMQSGFTNITHFERVFKNVTGLSPKKYILKNFS